MVDGSGRDLSVDFESAATDDNGGAGIEVQDPKSEGGSKRFAGFRDLDGNPLGLQEID